MLLCIGVAKQQPQHVQVWYLKSWLQYIFIGPQVLVHAGKALAVFISQHMFLLYLLDLCRSLLVGLLVGFVIGLAWPW